MLSCCVQADAVLRHLLGCEGTSALFSLFVMASLIDCRAVLLCTAVGSQKRFLSYG